MTPLDVINYCKLTNQEFADLLGVDVVTVYSWRQANPRPWSDRIVAAMRLIVENHDLRVKIQTLEEELNAR